jgi:hypothetical protein
LNNKLEMSDTFRFDHPGTLQRPGPIGRIVRLAFGVLCLWLAWSIAVGSGADTLHNPTLWFWVLFALVLAPYVVNIGFGVTWGAWPRVASALLLAASGTVSFVLTGGPLEYPAWPVVLIWMTYIYGHLGISFVLASILATPGCEMRSIPHLFGIVRHREALEHYCPGFIDTVDKWELERRRHEPDKTLDGGASIDRASRDLLGTTGAQLLVYGAPFAALQLAGNLAGFVIATSVPAAAFLLVGIVCLVNAVRCRRVHCYFMGPWCLLAGTLTALYSLRVIDLGPDSWSIIVNTGLAGALIIYMTVERAWGKYYE